MRRRLAAALAAMAAMAASCVGGLRSSAPPVVTYVLRAAPAARPGAAAAPLRAATLRVLRPIAAPGLDSDHIALALSDRRLTWYAASRWAARLPEMVESLAVETFRRGGGWRAVEDSRGAASADYFLEIGIRRFEAEEGGGSRPPIIHVALDCTLGRRADRALVASVTVERTEAARENRLGAVVEAFERAADSALIEADARIGDAAQHTVPAAGDQNSESPVASINR